MAALTGPDGQEQWDEDAKDNYDRLVRQKDLYDGNEINSINFLRECYRRSFVQGDKNKGKWMGGGALVFNGANMRLNDNGYYYSMWRNFPNLEINPRKSSHDSDRDQYEIYLDQAGVILVGMCNRFAGVPFGPHTWLQSERHAGGSANPLQRIGHVLSYFDHKLNSNTQVGAFGYSPFSEKEMRALLVEDLPPYPFGP